MHWFCPGLELQTPLSVSDMKSGFPTFCLVDSLSSYPQSLRVPFTGHTHRIKSLYGSSCSRWCSQMFVCTQSHACRPTWEKKTAQIYKGPHLVSFFYIFLRTLWQSASQTATELASPAMWDFVISMTSICSTSLLLLSTPKDLILLPLSPTYIIFS